MMVFLRKIFWASWSHYKKLAFVLYFFTQGGWIRHVWKRLACFPHCNGNGSWVICVLLVLSYFLICFTPNQTQYYPTDALKSFLPLNAVSSICAHLEGMVVYDYGRKGEHWYFEMGKARSPGGPILIPGQVMPAVSNCVCKWKHPSCCLTKKLRTFVCPGRSLGNATCSAFLSVGASAVWVSDVRTGLKNLQNNRKTGLSQ